MINILLIIFLVIGAIFWCVESVFGPQYITCDCGDICEVSSDGRFYWECSSCKRSGKAKPF
jgi:hypothetical protein